MIFQENQGLDEYNKPQDTNELESINFVVPFAGKYKEGISS